MPFPRCTWQIGKVYKNFNACTGMTGRAKLGHVCMPLLSSNSMNKNRELHCGLSDLPSVLHVSSQKSTSIRLCSSKTEALDGKQGNLVFNLDDKTGVGTLEMKRKPVNSLSLEFLTELSIALEKIENTNACRGLILTSGCPNIFSAGLDIMEMYNGKKERLSVFWQTLQDVWIRLYGLKCSTMAAVTGHAPAGGALLAMSCDYRAMTNAKYTIGLNESILGIVAPFWFSDTMVNTVGHRKTEISLALGALYTPEEALKMGLVDWLGSSSEDVVAHCRRQLDTWLRIPDTARVLSKQMMRKETIDTLVRRREKDVENFVEFVTKDSIQKNLGAYLAAMKKRQAEAAKTAAA